MDAARAERERKAALGLELRAMHESPAYKAVLARISENCGKLYDGWLLADEQKAAMLREMGRGYRLFDALVLQMINEGDAAKKYLQGDETQSSPGRPDRPGQGE